MTRKRLFQTIGLALQRDFGARGQYLREKHIFTEMGKNVRFSLVRYRLLNKIGKGHFPERVGCIEIIDNVFIGYDVTILPNIKIGCNCIIGA